jgi:hypothetical protein
MAGARTCRPARSRPLAVPGRPGRYGDTSVPGRYAERRSRVDRSAPVPTKGRTQDEECPLDDHDLIERISHLVDEEHALETRRADHTATDQQRLRQLEVQLDQCWDLLRQRRARRDAGEDPNRATSRPASTVEGYQQ